MLPAGPLCQPSSGSCRGGGDDCFSATGSPSNGSRSSGSSGSGSSVGDSSCSSSSSSISSCDSSSSAGSPDKSSCGSCSFSGISGGDACFGFRCLDLDEAGILPCRFEAAMLAADRGPVAAFVFVTVTTGECETRFLLGGTRGMLSSSSSSSGYSSSDTGMLSGERAAAAGLVLPLL